MASKKQILNDLIRPVVEGLGYECWGIEYLSQGKHTVLRVYIERPVEAEQATAEEGDSQREGPERESGIELADCEKVSRQLSGVLDVEDPISGDYTLEVSSPGMDRPLYELAHFQRFAGHQVALKLRMPFEGRRKFNGLLVGVEGHDVVLRVDQEEYLLPLEGIEKANVVPQFD
ncbi:MAG: ribosome maturation factor RimP [Oleiphilaceae bacterium]|nr:ribosome maturation factor RimP [Oleiphilaceae bacterium]